MTIDDFLDRLVGGLRNTLSDIRDFSDDPDASIRPEYLKTIAVARVLKDSVEQSAWIKLEQDTGRTLGASVLPDQRQPNFSKLVSRSGEIDIVLGVNSNGWGYPVILIENKLFAAGYSTIEADAIRCAEFVSAQGETGSIEVAAVTYFRRETQGVVTSHQDRVGERALSRITDAAANLATQLNVMHRHKHIKLVSTAIANKEQALSEDEDGMPAYLAQPTYTIWGAVELFYRTPTPSRFYELP